MPGMTWVVQVPKKPSQLVFVPSMAISQQYLMPSLWFLGRGLDFVQKLDTWRNRRTSCCGWPTEIFHCRG